MGLGAFASGGCSGHTTDKPQVVVTIPPLKLILQEIVGKETEVACILPPGASPHTFELRPSTARTLSQAKVVFFTDESIDGWVVRSTPTKPHALFAMVPEDMRLELGDGHIHGPETEQVDAERNGSLTANAHFWSDPLTVRAIVPSLVAILAQLDPADEARLEANGQAFMKALTDLDQALQAERPAGIDYGLVAFHPSWDYFFHRYGIRVSAYIEPLPGKEPTPGALMALQAAVMNHPRRVILSEEQLPAKPAQVLAESLEAAVTVIDPLGDGPNRDTYVDFIRYNADLLWSALK